MIISANDTLAAHFRERVRLAALTQSPTVNRLFAVLTRHPYRTTLVLSLLGSLLKIGLTSYPLSSDGAFYLRVAEAFSSGGIQAAQDLYYYPFFSILISFCSTLTGLSPLHAGQLVCTLLVAIASLAFVAIIRLQSRDRVVTFAAIALIALIPQVNDLKEQIYRDFGLWAFTLSALYMLIRFEQSGKNRCLLYWLLLQLAAGLFKQEGLVLLLAPALLLVSRRDLFRMLRVPARIVIVTAGLAALAGLYYLSNDAMPWEVQYASRLVSIPEHIAEKAAALEGAVLNQYSERHSVGLYLWMLAVLFVLSFVKAAKTAIMIPVLYTLGRGWRGASVSTSLKVYVVLACIPLLVFLVELQFLAGRYLGVLVLLALLATLPGLVQQRTRAPRFAFWFGLLLYLSFAVESYSVSPFDDAQLRDSERWLVENADKDATVFTNARAFTYVIDRLAAPEDGFADNAPDIPSRYDYYIHLSSRKNPAKPSFTTQEPVAVFEAEKGKRAAIYKFNHGSDRP